MESLDQFFSSMFTLERWPFWATALIFTIIGQFTAKSVFTRERAYLKRRSQPFWWWGRESLAVHPILAGIPIGLLWVNPEGQTPPWSIVASCVYFATAGAVSTILWILIKGYAKAKGVELTLPGHSSNPPKDD